MKKILFVVMFLITVSFHAKAQQCIDALVKIDKDTVWGIITAITDSTYTIDSYNFVFSIHKNSVAQYLPCFRQATKADIARMKPLDALNNKDLFYNTSGYYFRKSARNFYTGIGFTLIGSVAIPVGIAIFNEPQQSTAKWVTVSCGAVSTAAGLFFILKSFYFIDKAGKILDLERSSIYLRQNENGDIGLIFQF